MNLSWSVHKIGCLFWRVHRGAAWCAILLILCACGGGPEQAAEVQDKEGQPSNWQRISIVQVEEIGTTVPFVVARQGANADIHLAWYNAVSVPEDHQYHQIHHLVWNAQTHATSGSVVVNRPAPSGVDGFDRCDQFDMTVDGDVPILIYPTYQINEVLQQVEADIMVNLFEQGGWRENTGAVGFVERNPVYQDGHTTENMSVAADSQGSIHFCYQYFTEGMDSANFRYPDLYYAHWERTDLADPIDDITQYAQIEELVDGNTFSTYGIHNSVGYFCKLIVDDQDLPVIVYAEHGENFMGTYALKAAFKDEGGQWHRQTVEVLPDGWEIGAISAAFYPPDLENPDAERPLAIAYAIRVPDPEPDSGHHLKYATNRGGQWSTELVDETTWCGAHCSLAFNAQGQPAIAYHDEQSHLGRLHQFLKYAEFDGLRWNRESAEEYGIVGRYNTLWFDSQGVPNICTFSDEDNEIVVIRQIN
jgi:hypothetical protein